MAELLSPPPFSTSPPARGDEVQLEIIDAAVEGKSVARLGNFVVFVENGIPGDLVLAKIYRTKKKFAEARILRVERPSPFRVQPRCQHAGVCGGCKWQHLAYDQQLHSKQRQVIDAFERIGGFTNLNVLPILGAKEQFFYRNKMEYSFTDQEWLTEIPESPTTNLEPSNRPSNVFLGLHVPQRYDKVLDIQACHLQSEVSNRILTFTRQFARASRLAVHSTETDSGYWRFLVIRQSSAFRNPVQPDKPTNDLMVNVVTFEEREDVIKQYADELTQKVPEVTTIVNTINTKKAQIAFGDRERVAFGSGYIRERLGRHTFTISASSFFQTNTEQAEVLYGVAKEFAEFKPNDVVYDLYSGTGSIALFVSDAVSKVIGVESAESSVLDARKNAEANGITNCEFVLGDLKDRLTKDKNWMESHPVPHVMMIDPPRSGMHPKVVEEILRIAPERIVYVSCNPATQARDVKLLAPKYTVDKLQPVDMFPHTYHIENVARLTLR